MASAPQPGRLDADKRANCS